MPSLRQPLECQPIGDRWTSAQRPFHSATQPSGAGNSRTCQQGSADIYKGECFGLIREGSVKGCSILLVLMILLVPACSTHAAGKHGHQYETAIDRGQRLRISGFSRPAISGNQFWPCFEH